MSRVSSPGRLLSALLSVGAMFAGVVLAGLVAVPDAAFARAAAPGWEVQAVPYPTHFKPGGEGYVLLQIFNVGGKASSGPVTVTDVLPKGMVATEAGWGREEEPLWACSVGSVVTCTNEEEYLPEIGPGSMRTLLIAVKVPEGMEGTAENEATVAGGGALTPGSSVESLEYDAQGATFGFKHVDGWFSNEDGSLSTQAGSHFYSFTTDLRWNNLGYKPTGQPRSVTVNLPRGLVGNPTAVPRCTSRDFNYYHCPADTQVGVDYVALGGVEAALGEEGKKRPIDEYYSPVFALDLDVYNLVPPPGEPAQLGFQLASVGARINANLRDGSDYGIKATIDNIPEKQITYNALVLWGEPGDPSHNYQRASTEEEGELIKYGVPSGYGRTPFWTLPTSCEGPLRFTASTAEWGEEGVFSPISENGFATHTNAGVETGITGCDRLTFAPSITVAPDTSEADAPAGLTVEVKTPQEALDTPGSLVTSNIKDTTVTLPEGVVINPAQAHGLAVCSQAQSGVGTEGPVGCPTASKVGSDEIETPLLAHSLKGDVYVLESNPPNLKLLVHAAGEGVNLKLVGDVHLDEATGRLTTTFTETPELPFTTFRLSFSGGPQAALTTPTRCGAYTTTSDFVPWSSPSVPDAFPSSEFTIGSGAGGSSCPGAGPLPFAPLLTAGATTDQAGGFTNFSMLLTREDGQQRIGALQFKTPEGLLGMISKVTLCTNAQAESNACPASSQIGHTVVEAGPGPYPLVVPEPGQPPAPIYLTEGYKGAPYGLSIVVPLHVGPFTLQTQRVRAKIDVDPLTTELTITTDPLPTIVDGVPADLRAINAVIDRPEFMFNPTGCEPQSFSGTAYGTEGSTAPISSHFQMGSCRSLTFKPNFKVSTSGKTSRKNGASLDAKIVYPTGKLEANQASSQANVKSVKVDLPKQLPSRLTTLQKACPSATFEANPASCPSGSKVGTATAITPVLPVQLTGPAYFVSYGGAKFPELVIVLQGYGVTVFLHGETFISKAGITSSTFRQVPDVPITSFELKLPQGANSALAANGNLCNKALRMPTAFTGQNGAVIHQSTPISVTGCAKHKKAHKKKRNAKKGAKKRK